MIPIALLPTEKTFKTHQNWDNLEQPVTIPIISRRLQSAPAELGSRRGNEEFETESETGLEGKWTWRKFIESAFGNAPYITEIIGGIASPQWQIVANIFLSILLGISSVIFASNPLSGLIIFCTMVYSAPKAAILGLVTLLSGILTSMWVLRLPMKIIIGGSITFNCFLLGSVVDPLVGGTTSWQEVVKLIPLCGALGFCVIYLWSGMNGLLHPVNLPVLSAPTNLLALILIFSGILDQYEIGHKGEILFSKPATFNLSNEAATGITPLRGTLSPCNCTDWDKVLYGVLLAQGQIFQTTGIVPSLVFYLCAFMYSPILCFQEFLGAAIGALIGLGFSEQCNADVYNGSWGYNSLLTAAAIGGLFIAFNFQSWLVSVVGAIFAALLYAVLEKNGVPVLGIPFMLITWLFLPMAIVPERSTQQNDRQSSCCDLERVTNFTTPESNILCFFRIETDVNNEKYHRPDSLIIHV